MRRPKVLYTKLARWGYTKNIKRHQATAILGEKSSREIAGKGYDFAVQGRPVDLGRVQRNGKRAGLLQLVQGRGHAAALHPPTPSGQGTVECRTPPPALSLALP